MRAVEHGTAMNPLFVMDDSLFHTLNWEDVKATRNGLVEVGLFSLPAPIIDIRWRPHALENAAFLQRAAGGKASTWDASEWLLVRGVELRREKTLLSLEGLKPTVLHKIAYDDVENEDGERFPFGGTSEEKLRVLMGLTTILIVSLATANVEKTVTARKPGKLRANGSPKHLRVTTIRVPRLKYLPSAHGASTGREVRTHFRRGHPTWQVHGPGRGLRKRIWIAPMFVKADPNYVPPRPPEYRVTA